MANAYSLFRSGNTERVLLQYALSIDDMKYCKLELVNREENYNQLL
jgi:hypothetical protein